MDAKTRTALLSACATCLLRATHGREPLDPVARFHLAIGARLERPNWMGDTSSAPRQAGRAPAVGNRPSD